MIKLNLLPKNKKKNLRYYILWRRLLVVQISIIALISLFAFTQICFSFVLKQINNTISAKDNELINKADKLEEQVNKLNNELSNEINKKLELITKADQNDPQYSYVLGVIARLIPQTSQLAKIKINHIKPKKEPDYHQVEIQGIASKREDVLALKKALEQENLFKNIYSPLANLTKPENINFVFTFTLQENE